MPDSDYINEVATRLLGNLSELAGSVYEKYEYYNATQRTKDLGVSIPPRMAKLKPGVGWATRAVNTLGDRLNFDGFANDNFSINKLFREIGANSVLDKTKTDALIAGCAFVAIVGDGNSYRLLPFTASEATGDIDQNTGRLLSGVAVTGWYGKDESSPITGKWGNLGLVPRDYIVFLPEATAIYERQQLVRVIPNPTGRPLLHVITHRQSADRPFGKARVSNTVRRIVDEVGRLKLRYEIAAEFYSTPQRYINGLAQGAKKDASIDSAIGKVWTVTKDEDGDKPEIGQLAQMTISQFSEQKKDLARDFCAETALTLRNLGYETSNPTSAESLSAMSDDLLLEAQECQNEMGNEFKDIAVTLEMLRQSTGSIPTGMIALQASWKPIFQLDVGAAGDAIYKLFEVMPELKGTITAYKMLGMSITEAEELSSKRANSREGFMEAEVEE